MKATLLARTAPSSVRCKDRRISEAATTRHPVCASRRLSEGAKPLFLARIRASEKRRHARNSVRLAMIRAANSTSTYASRPCEMPSSSMMPSSSSIISRLSTWNFGLGAHRHQVGRSSLVYCFRHFSRSGRALYLPFQIWDKGRVEGGGRRTTSWDLALDDRIAPPTRSVTWIRQDGRSGLDI